MKIQFLQIVLASFFFFTYNATAQVFVKHDATGTNDGSSWENAYTDLTVAINATAEGDQLWVAAGTYNPDGTLALSDAYFRFPHDLEMYGGFAGTETILSERDWFANEIILSGDHNDDDDPDDPSVNKSDNSFHVMWLTDTITNATTIDGFSIKFGNTGGVDSTGNFRRAGGILTYGSPIVRNCLFESNYGYFAGSFYPIGTGAANFVLEDCVFSNNRAQFGAGVYDLSSGGTITNCIFFLNQVEGRGGGIYTSESNTIITNCLFENNISNGSSGGALQVRGDDDFNSTVNINDCTFSNNSANFGGALGCYDSTAVVNVTNCTFEENSAVNVGGGISVAFEATCSVLNCTFTDNNADLTGGALFVQNNNSTLNIDFSFCSYDSEYHFQKLIK